MKRSYGPGSKSTGKQRRKNHFKDENAAASVEQDLASVSARDIEVHPRGKN
jgi:hypothetical protein